jgi:hypothetical protein
MQSSSPNTPSVPLVARSCNVTPPPAGLTHLDVLCGRQTHVLRHEGNQIYSRIVRSLATQYQSCKTKKNKAKITFLVIEKIHQQGGRFLKMTDDGCWSELDNQSALEKVQHALRSTRTESKSSSERSKPSRGTARAVIVETSQEEDMLFKEILAKQQELYAELLSSSRSSSTTSQREQQFILPTFTRNQAVRVM